MTPGAAADVVVWPLEGVQHAGAWADPVESLLRCGPNAARHTIVNGEFVVRDGRLVDTRVGEMLQRHEAVARRWQGLA